MKTGLRFLLTSLATVTIALIWAVEGGAAPVHRTAAVVDHGLVWVDSVAAGRARAGTLPPGRLVRVTDCATSGDACLVLAEHGANTRPEPGEATRCDLWLISENRPPALVHEDAITAALDPAAKRVALITHDHRLLVGDLLSGSQIRSAGPAASVAWAPSGSAIAYSRTERLSGHRSLVWLDSESGVERSLTNGEYDDTRPLFSPDGRWLFFVSGARTGLASLWRVPVVGGEPVQVTNVGAHDVTPSFTPTPYMTCVWSPDGRRLAFDFKNDSLQEVWTLTFDRNYDLVRAERLGDGLYPTWSDDSHQVTFLRMTGATVAPQKVRLP